jgi:hypothetical protein
MTLSPGVAQVQQLVLPLAPSRLQKNYGRWCSIPPSYQCKVAAVESWAVGDRAPLPLYSHQVQRRRRRSSRSAHGTAAPCTLRKLAYF